MPGRTPACAPESRSWRADRGAARRRRPGAGSSSRPASRAEEATRATQFGDATIRGFRYVSQLAESPVSSVYLAESERNGSKVALKVLHQPPDEGAGVRNFDRFLREYQIAAAIEHPNVARVHDFGVADDHAFIAMEYFPLGDLRGRIKQGIQPLRALTFLRQMAEALKVLHDAGVLHRDLKPGNVMLRDELSLALIDYGLSKHVDLDATLTNSGEIFGTPYYMSPEQGHGHDTDARSDIYSIGIIFYEMLMRRKPYVAGTPMQVIYKHAHAPLPELKAEFKRFEEVLYNCIAKDPQTPLRQRGQLAGCCARTRARRNASDDSSRLRACLRRAGWLARSAGTLVARSPPARRLARASRALNRFGAVRDGRGPERANVRSSERAREPRPAQDRAANAQTGQGMSCQPESSHRTTFASSCQAPSTMRV